MAYDILKGSSGTPLLFLLVQSSDHITGLTGASPTVKIGKNGGTGAAPSGAVTEIDSTNLPGWYKVAGNATDTNTAGPLTLHASATSADPFDNIVANIIDPTVAIYGANAVQINAVATTSVTTVNANVGTTQAITFDANNFPKVDLVDIAGSSVSTSSAQLGVNAVNIAGHAATVDSNNLLQVAVTDVINTALTETVAGNLAGGIKKFFNVSSPTSTMNEITLVDTTTAVTNQVTANVTDWNGSAPNNLISGRVDSNAQAMATGVISNTTFAAGAVDSSAFAQSAADKAWSTAARTLTSTGGVFRFAKNTAIANFQFVMTDATTHAPKTGLTVTTQHNIDNAGFASTTNSAVEVASGWYVINLSAADLNGNVIGFRFSATGADDLDFTVVTTA